MDYDDEPYVEPRLVFEWRTIAEKYKEERNELAEKVLALEAEIRDLKALREK